MRVTASFKIATLRPAADCFLASKAATSRPPIDQQHLIVESKVYGTKRFLTSGSTRFQTHEAGRCAADGDVGDRLRQRFAQKPSACERHRRCTICGSRLINAVCADDGRQRERRTTRRFCSHAAAAATRSTSTANTRAAWRHAGGWGRVLRAQPAYGRQEEASADHHFALITTAERLTSRTDDKAAGASFGGRLKFAILASLFASALRARRSTFCASQHFPRSRRRSQSPSRVSDASKRARSLRARVRNAQRRPLRSAASTVALRAAGCRFCARSPSSRRHGRRPRL